MADLPPSERPLARFARSMQPSFGRWHDGLGYDLEALDAADADERAAIESLLVARGAREPEDVEALARLGTPRARAALRAGFESGDTRIAMAVLHHARDVVSDAERDAALVAALERGAFYHELTQAIDLVTAPDSPAVVGAVLRGALGREGEVAVHLAALAMFVHGRTAEAFDWDERPFFLRFLTEEVDARRAVFTELCERIGVDPARYLAGG